MKIHEHKRSRRDLVPARNLRPEEAAALRKLAMQWREEWRHEVAAGEGQREGNCNRNRNGVGRLAPTPKKATAKQRTEAAKFAAAMARNEFGRFYWNGKLAGQLASATKAGPAQRRPRKSDRAVN